MSGTAEIPGAGVVVPVAGVGARPVIPKATVPVVPPRPQEPRLPTWAKEKLDGIESGAQANVIEQIFVNSSKVSPVAKRVNISVPETTTAVAEGNARVPTSGTVFSALASLLEKVVPEWSSSQDPNYYHDNRVAYKGQIYKCTATHYAQGHEPPDESSEWVVDTTTVYDLLAAMIQRKLDNYGACTISSSGRLQIIGASSASNPELLVLTDEQTGMQLRMFGKPMSHSPGVAFFSFRTGTNGTPIEYWLPGASGTLALKLESVPLGIVAPEFSSQIPYAKGETIITSNWSPHGYGAVVAALRFTQDHPAGDLAPGWSSQDQKDYEQVTVWTLIKERAAKPTSFVAGNLAAFDSDGNLVDTGYHIEDVGGTPTLVETT